MEERLLTCIECPLGCSITVKKEGDTITVSGNGCPRGKGYAEAELICPVRVVTSTVRAKNGKMVSVKTDRPVKKSEMFCVMQKINQATCDLPIKIGDVIVPNVEGDANVIATCNVEE